MTHRNQTLSAFCGDTATDQDRDDNHDSAPDPTDQSTPETADSDNQGNADCFADPPAPYPAAAIEGLAANGYQLSLCGPDNSVLDTAFTTIAGTGGMGPPGELTDSDQTIEVARQFNRLPVRISGGGMGTPGGAGFVLAIATDIVVADETLKLTYQPLFKANAAISRTRNSRTITIGSYELAVPTTKTDCENAITALETFRTGDISYLDPAERERQRRIDEAVSSFESLSPGDKLDTPAYSTTLTVVSRPFETAAIIPRGTLSDATVDVTAVTVNNPRGGYYQLGLGRQRTRGATDPLSCFLSASTKSPPTPNTAFTRDQRFGAFELEITPIKAPSSPEIVGPDRDVLRSPLPEPRLRTSLEEVEGIGEKTARRLWKATNGSISAETLAYTLHCDGNHHRQSIQRIQSILDDNPQKAAVLDRLHTYVPTDGPADGASRHD